MENNMDCKKILAGVAVGAAALTSEAESFAFEREEPEKYWNIQELYKVPNYRDSGFEDSKAEGMKDLMKILCPSG